MSPTLGTSGNSTSVESDYDAALAFLNAPISSSDGQALMPDTGDNERPRLADPSPLDPVRHWPTPCIPGRTPGGSVRPRRCVTGDQSDTTSHKEFDHDDDRYA